MINKQYELQYLPLFYDDLRQTLTYIERKLHNPQAAADLLDAVEDRKNPYYAIYVKNFVVYYVVLEHRIMEVRRFLYKRQNRQEMI